jgi:hypothetical protein
MAHSYLVELSAARVVRALEENASGRGMQVSLKSPFGRDRAAAGRPIAPPDDDRHEQLDRELATEYGDRLREAHPHTELTGDAFTRSAREAVELADALLSPVVAHQREVRLQQLRTWTDKKGHSTLARMKAEFADQVVLELQTGGEVTVPLDKLSEADLAFVAQQSADEPPSDDMVVAQMQLVMQAIRRHVERTGRFPPAYIVDGQGRPLLSWRVALLEDLGAEELLALFRFDEPWDSDHNRRLLECMPAVFTPAQEGRIANHTTLVGFRGANSVLADGRSVNPREMNDPANTVVVFGEVRAAHSVPWTQPDDLASKDFEKLGEIMFRRGDSFFVATSDGSVRTVPAKTSKHQWQRAISYSDGVKPGISFGVP